jgi:hypothetical protein
MSGASEGVEDRDAKISSLAFYDAVGRELVAARTGGPMMARINFVAHESITNAVFEIFFYSGNRELLCHLSTEFSEQQIDLNAGAGIAEVACQELGLRPGIYYADATIKVRGALDDLDWQRNCATLRVDPGKMQRGSFYMPHEWHVRQRCGRTDSIQSNVSGLFDTLDDDRMTVEVKPS